MQTPATLTPDLSSALPPGETEAPPDHTQLPDKDGTFVTNFQEHPQSNLLTDSLMPRLDEVRPDGQFCVGSDSGIYWRNTNPALAGCKSPDWYVVLGVPPMLDGVCRRSYVLWKEAVRPLLLIEYVSGDGSEEHDTTPQTGKFWVYEQCIAAPYYLIFDAWRHTLEMFQLAGGHYQSVQPNAHGRYPVDALRVEFGLWDGVYRGQNLPWVRAWDAATGELLLASEEREVLIRQRAEAAEGHLDDARQLLNDEALRAEAVEEQAEAARQRAEKLAEKLRALGIDPDA